MNYIMQIILACNESLEVNCQNQCNFHCINKTCNRIDGSCLYGCLDGQQCVDGIFPISIRFLNIFFIKKHIIVMNTMLRIHWINETIQMTL